MNSDGTKNQLTYKSYEKFKELIDSNSPSVMNYFSTNESGELIIAESVRTTIEKTTEYTDAMGQPINTNKDNKPTVYTFTEKAIDYKSLISQYSTPISFFIELGTVTRNPEFLEKVADLVKKKARIELTILDTTVTQESVQVDSYVKHTIAKYYTAGGRDIKETTSDTTIKETTKITEITKISNLKVTYANTWICESKITYNKLPSNVQSSGPEEIDSPYVDEEPKTWPEEQPTGEITWITDSQSTLTTKTTIDTYDNGTTSDYVDNTDDFIALLNVEYKIPNSKEKRSAGAYLKSGAEMLFAFLRQNPETQGLEQVMRYIMYKYTGKDYGVTSLDFSVYDPKYFSSAASVTTLADYLYSFAHGGKDAPQSPDGKYYKMYGDSAGWPTIGNADLQWKTNHTKFNLPGKVLKSGVETEVPSIEEYVNDALGRGAEDKYTTEEISKKEIYIEKKIVDEIGNDQIRASLESVKLFTNGLNLSTQQLYALVHVYISKPTYISGDNINGYTSFKQVYQAAAAKYKPDSWEFNRFIWDEWWCYLGGGLPEHIYSRDMEFETYDKGIFDFSKSSAGPVGGRTHYIYYTQEQLNRFSYAPKKPITRSASNEQEIFTYVARKASIVEAAYEVADHFLNSGVDVHYAGNSVKGSTNNGRFCVFKNIQGAWDYPVQNPEKYGVVCATFVSLAIWRAGLIEEVTINSYGYNGCGGLETMLNNAGSKWQKITNKNELQEGDIVICSDHAWIYIDGNKRLDQNYCVISSSGEDERGKLQNGYYTNFREAFRYVGG